MSIRLVESWPCFVWLLASCGWAVRAPAASPTYANADPLQQFRVDVDTSMSDQNRITAVDLVAATLRVVASPAFEGNLAATQEVFGDLWLSPFGERISAAQTSAAYRGAAPAHRAPRIILVQSSDGRNATSWNSMDRRVVIRLNPVVLEQWAADRLVTRSCAVNTLAHELSHVVPQSQGEFLHLFQDGKRFWATWWGRPLASYTIGAVAQCTYLGRSQQKTGGWLSNCVRSWGTNQFYSGDC